MHVFRTAGRPAILEEVEKSGHVIFEKGEFNLNIIVTRLLPGRPNRFDDLLNIVWREEGKWVDFRCQCTADPGLSRVQSSMKGLASVVPGQYRGVWKLGLHGASRPGYAAYEALVQRGPISVWRDRNRDGSPDREGRIETGLFGINYHRATKTGTSIIVDDWSEGCIVNPSVTDFDESIRICKRAAAFWGDRFTLTLLEREAV